MENNMLQAILDEIKKIDNKIDGVSSELKSFKKEMHEFKEEMNEFREDTKKEFNQINVKLDRLEENQPQDITAHLKQLQNVDKKTDVLNKRVFELEARLNN